MVRVKERLLVVVPLTLILIVAVVYLNARSIIRTSIVLLAVPFFAIGAFGFLYLRRLQPTFMTVAAMRLGLVPIMMSNGPGSDVVKRIAAPLAGGILTSFLLELTIYPPLFQIWKWTSEVRGQSVK